MKWTERWIARAQRKADARDERYRRRQAGEIPPGRSAQAVALYFLLRKLALAHRVNALSIQPLAGLNVVSVGLRIYVSNQLRSTFAFYKDDVLCFIAAVCLRQRAGFQPY